ncbi:hypothetical protein OQA88_7086 [Cercophora sp. LCS_1]
MSIDSSPLPRARKPVPPPEPAYMPTSLSSPLIVNEDVYRTIQQAERTLVDEFVLPIRSGRAWTAKAGSIIRISTPDGPQVGDLNIWNASNPRERFWASRTRQLHASHISTYDRLWSCLPYMRPMLTIIHDALSWYGKDERGGRVHDLLGTRCDPYIRTVLAPGDQYDFHCHSNLVRAVLPFGLAESDVHDVINLFQATGLDEKGRYCMSPCPAEKGDFIEFFAEQDVLMALMVALPLLALSAVGLYVLSTTEAVPFARIVLHEGAVELNKKNGVPILDEFYGVSGLDSLFVTNTVSLANVFFLPSLYGYDALSRAQVISFLSDGGVVLAVWWLESLRGNKRPWYLRYPSILTLVVLSTVESSTAALFPALLLGYYIPAFGMFFWPNLVERQSWLFVWQLYPLHVALAFFALSSLRLGFSESGGDRRLKQLSRDLVGLRLTIGIPALISATAWGRTLYENRSALASLFFPTGRPHRFLPDLTAFCGEFLRWDELLVMLSMISWLFLVCWETTRFNTKPQSWARDVTLGVLLLLLGGPGLLLAVGWQRREETLTKRWERELLLEEVAAKVNGLLRANDA